MDCKEARGRGKSGTREGRRERESAELSRELCANANEIEGVAVGGLKRLLNAAAFLSHIN